jgi:hypothetical protein
MVSIQANTSSRLLVRTSSLVNFIRVGMGSPRSGRNCGAAGPTRLPSGHVDGSVSWRTLGLEARCPGLWRPRGARSGSRGLTLGPGCGRGTSRRAIPDVDGQSGPIHLDREALEMTADSARQALGAHPLHALRDEVQARTSLPERMAHRCALWRCGPALHGRHRGHTASFTAIPQVEIRRPSPRMASMGSSSRPCR